MVESNQIPTTHERLQQANLPELTIESTDLDKHALEHYWADDSFYLNAGHLATLKRTDLNALGRYERYLETKYNDVNDPHRQSQLRVHSLTNGIASEPQTAENPMGGALVFRTNVDDFVDFLVHDNNQSSLQRILPIVMQEIGQESSRNVIDNALPMRISKLDDDKHAMRASTEIARSRSLLRGMELKFKVLEKFAENLEAKMAAVGYKPDSWLAADMAKLAEIRQAVYKQRYGEAHQHAEPEDKPAPIDWAAWPHAT